MTVAMVLKGLSQCVTERNEENFLYGHEVADTHRHKENDRYAADTVSALYGHFNTGA